MLQEEKQQTGATDDLAKDLQFEGDEYKNMEGESRSTAAEGTLNKADQNTQKENETPTAKDEQAMKDGTTSQPAENTTNDDPTYRPSLAEDESMDKEQG